MITGWARFRSDLAASRNEATIMGLDRLL